MFLARLRLRDTRQSQHAVLRNYSVIGHRRFCLEFIRPEMRQYLIEHANESAPFLRQQRSLVYRRANGDPDKRPFDTQRDVTATGPEWTDQSMVPTALDTHDFRITIGAGPSSSCMQPYSASVLNSSAMSFGALSTSAILALNGGAQRRRPTRPVCARHRQSNVSRYHREHGGDLIWEIGSGYVNCRHADGTFEAEMYAENAT